MFTGFHRCRESSLDFTDVGKLRTTVTHTEVLLLHVHEHTVAPAVIDLLVVPVLSFIRHVLVCAFNVDKNVSSMKRKQFLI